MTIIPPAEPSLQPQTHLKEEGCSPKALAPAFHCFYIFYVCLLSLSPCGTVPTQPQRTQKGIGCLIPFRQGLPLSWSWATKAQPSCLHLTLALWSQASRSHLAFDMTAGDLNSHLNACKASSLTTDPFPSLSPFIYLSVHLHLLGGGRTCT